MISSVGDGVSLVPPSAVALTFDDGPDPLWTPRVLDALRRAESHATFFAIAPVALRHPGVVSSIIEAGHAVEFHCVDHVRHTHLSRREAEADTREGLRMLRSLGVEPRFWRPPWGVLAPWTEEVAENFGLQLAPWSVDTRDWRGDPAREMLRCVESLLGPGEVVLMHDGIGPGALRTGCQETVSLVEPLVARLRSMGCEPASLTLPDLPAQAVENFERREIGGVRTSLGRTGETDTRWVSPNSSEFDPLLARICEGAAQRDADPAFPEEPFRALASADLLAMTVPDPVGAQGRRASFSEEWRVLRAVAAADGSVGRIFDGHLNGVERLAALAPEPLRKRELEAVAAGELLLGVWGADPIPGEGQPARLVDDETGLVLEGVKTFCSGSTGLNRALVAVRDMGGAPGLPLLVYVDLESGGIEVDRSWFRGFGMRSSESHRVVFRGARVLAILGEPGELVREPYFARDAIRTAVTWAGIGDLALSTALGILTSKSAGREPDEIVSVAAGRMLAARDTMNRWLEHAAREADADPNKSLASFSTSLRATVAKSCREILDEAARACGSHPFAVASPLDRARRDLELFLLQHRLEPTLARAGRGAITEHRSRS